MFGVFVEVVGDRAIDDGHAALVAIGSGMGEIGAVVDPHDEADMRSVAVGALGGDGADIAILQIGFGAGLAFAAQVVVLP